jgi:hypothetical protein
MCLEQRAGNGGDMVDLVVKDGNIKDGNGAIPICEENVVPSLRTNLGSNHLTYLLV